MINKFIAAIEHDEVDKEFWMAMYDTLAAPHIGQRHRVHGWVCNFFPYISENLDEQFQAQGTVKRLFRERGNKYRTFMMQENDFTSGKAVCPIKLNKKDYVLMTGILGVEVRNEVMDPKIPDEFWQYVKPAVGWALYGTDPTKKKPMFESVGT